MEASWKNIGSVLCSEMAPDVRERWREGREGSGVGGGIV